MRVAFKIWLLAIIYHTIIFSLLYGGLGDGMIFLFVPAELIAGLPALFIYSAILFHVHIGNYPLKRKWLITVIGIILSTMIATMLTVMFFEIKPSDLLENYLRLCSTVLLASLLALCSFALSVNKYLDENTAKKNP